MALHGQKFRGDDKMKRHTLGFLTLLIFSCTSSAAPSSARQLTASSIKNGSGVLTLPTSTDTLMGRATADTVTNKILSGNTAVNLISGSGTLTLNTSGTVTLPNATDTLAGKATTDTFTNKSLDADTNTITNIDNNEIKAAAAISLNKLAAATVSRALVSDGSGFVSPATTTATEIGYVNGVTSAIQTQMNLKAPLASPTFSGTITTPLTASRAMVTGASSELAVSSVTGTELGRLSGVGSTVCGKDDTCTETLRTFTSPAINGANLNFGTASNSNRLLLPTETTTNLSGLTQTAGLVAYDSTQGKPVYNNGTSWTTIGSGSGSTNFITNGDAEAGTTGWATYADAAASVPVDGTGGSPNVTWTRVTSSPLTSVGSFLFTKGAANRVGEGASYDFTIDSASQAKVMNVEFDYAVASGTFVAGGSSIESDIEIYIYDVTNATIIQPSTYKLYSSATSPPAHFFANFQTASNSTSYRILFHVASVSASAYTVKFDSISVSPSKYTYSTPSSDWTSFTPTGTWATNTTWLGKWRRVGDSMEVQASWSLSGAPTGTFTFNLPSGYTIDTTKLSTTSSASLGNCLGTDTGVANYQGSAYYNSTTSVACVTSAGWSATVPFTWGNTDAGSLNFKAPITGWSSSVQMSDSAPQAEITAIISGDPASATVGNPIIVPTVGYDSHGAYSASTGRYTVPFPGRYKVYGSLQSASSATTLTIYKNAASTALAGNLDSNGEATFTGMVNAVGGDLIDIRPGGTVDATAMTLNFERVGGPASIGATETVSFSSTFSAAQTGINTNASAVKLAYDTKLNDSHGSFSTSNNRFTAPIAGRYCFDAGLQLAGTNVIAAQEFMVLYKNGSAYRYATNFKSATGVAYGMNMSVCSIQLNAGDYVEIFFFGSGNNSASTLSTITGNGAGDYNYFSGYRLGN